MQEVIIRTNFNKNVGLGHLYRCIKLANELKKYYKITFAIDKKSKISKKIIKFKIIELYKGSTFKNQLGDANLLKRKIEKKNIKFIIVDDYRLDFNWEKFFFTKYQLIVFDDLNKKKHKCHFIIDAKWNSENTQNRYLNLVPKNCNKLLGPKYAMINPILNKRKKKENIFFYFGGAGDLSKFYKLILQFCIMNQVFKKKFNVDLVIGPMAYNYSRIKSLKKRFKFLNIVSNKFDLSIYLERCKFAFSNSSSIIYDLNYLNIPACLFSNSENQKNNISDLEDLGFYINIDLNKFLNSNKIQLLFLSLLKNLNRIKKLTNNKKILIDSRGVKRIVGILNNNKRIVIKDVISNSKFLNKNGYFKIKDSFVNQYLIYRNMIINRKRSLRKSLIQKHEHYIWWFNNSNLIEKYYYFNKKIISIFYHYEIKINNKSYWYGGWMTCEAKPNFFEIINFLKFQIKTSLLKKNLAWLAIIKKNNKFVYLINKKLKFSAIDNPKIITSIKKKFNISKKYEHHFLIK